MSLYKFLEYLTLEKNYSSHTVLAYKRDIEVFFDFLGRAVRPEDVSYAQIRGWVVHLVEQGLAQKTVNRKIASLKAYFKFLYKTQQIKENPLANHKRLREQKKIAVPFSETELEKVLYEVDFPYTFEGIRNKFIIELLYTTGMRRAELIALRLQDVDEKLKTVKVLGKRNKERILPLLDKTLVIYAEYLAIRNKLPEIADTDRLFLLSSGNKIYPMLVYRVINAYFSKASSKLKKSPHILRHTFATHLLNHGADLNSVKELLGHASLAATQVYVHNDIAKLKRAYSNSHPRSKK